MSSCLMFNLLKTPCHKNLMMPGQCLLVQTPSWGLITPPPPPHHLTSLVVLVTPHNTLVGTVHVIIINSRPKLKLTAWQSTGCINLINHNMGAVCVELCIFDTINTFYPCLIMKLKTSYYVIELRTIFRNMWMCICYYSNQTWIHRQQLKLEH